MMFGRSLQSKSATLTLLFCFVLSTGGFAGNDDEWRHPQKLLTPGKCAIYVAALAVGVGGGIAIFGLPEDKEKEWAEEDRQIAEAEERAKKGDIELKLKVLYSEKIRRGDTWYPHIGVGIFLDIENIEPLLSEHQKTLLKDPEKNALAIATFFSAAIYKKKGSTWNVSVDAPAKEYVPASGFFPGAEGKSGVCRHKACVLSGVLRHYGIKTKLVSGRFDEESEAGHVVVSLPDYNYVADPTNAEILFPNDEFYRGEDGVFVDPWDSDADIDQRSFQVRLIKIYNGEEKVRNYIPFEDAVIVNFENRSKSFVGERARRVIDVLKARGAKRSYP